MVTNGLTVHMGLTYFPRPPHSTGNEARVELHPQEHWEWG